MLPKVNKSVLLRLLIDNQLTRPAIAKRLGCSSQRVHQLELKLLGRTGHEAQQERRERRLREKFENKKFVKAARRKGLSVEPAKGARGKWYETELYVNGKSCLLRRAYENVGYKGWYVSIRKPRQKAEICILELKNGGFLMIPMKKMPRSKTMFRTSSKGVYTLRLSWRKYLNNWSVLNQGKKR